MESEEKLPEDTPPPPQAKPPKTEQRGMVSTIHYHLSFIGRNLDKGPQGAIVLLHDLPGGAFTWMDTLPKLVGTGRAIYAIDLLGYGESDRPWPSDTSIWGHADNLSYAFEGLGLTQIVLVGFGLGGAVAQVLATRLYREQTAKLVLIDSYAYQYAFAPNWPLPDMSARQDPEAAMHTPTDQLLADLRTSLPVAAANPTLLAGSKLDAYIQEWNSSLGKNLLFQHIRLMNPIYMNSVSSDLRQLEIPVLLIWGESDQVTPVSLGERMSREISAARLRIVRNAGHLVLDEAPESVGGFIAEFAGSPARS